MASGHATKVEVELEGVEGVRQPEEFVLCPFGVQFYSLRELAPHSPVELSVRVTGGGNGADAYTCLGVTIESVKDDGRDMYCTFIKFLHVPAVLYPAIRCEGPSGAHICNFCEGDLSERVPEHFS